MNQLQPIIQKGQRVLTTQQIAEAYGTVSKVINRNFQRNTERYTPGKHFIALTGDDLRNFKGLRQSDESLKFVSVLYLWTEKGALLHAKSLNTEQAWNAYETLVDEYYTIKENVVPLSKEKALVTVLRTTADLVEGHEELKSTIGQYGKKILEIEYKVDEQITLDHGEQRRLQKGVASRVYELETNPTQRPRLFREIYREIKDRFAVASYKDIKRKELQSALRYIENWIPRKVS